jgi:hypothetical protein
MSASDCESKQGRQCYIGVTRELTPDEEVFMRVLAQLGMNEPSRLAFFSTLGVESMQALSIFNKESIQALC